MITFIIAYLLMVVFATHGAAYFIVDVFKKDINKSIIVTSVYIIMILHMIEMVDFYIKNVYLK